MKKAMYCFAALMLAFSFNMTAVAMESAKGSDETVSDSKTKKEYKTVKFDVSLKCENCKKKITENIAFEKGVKKLEVSLEDHTVTITYDPTKTDEEKLANAIRELGYTVNGE